MAKMSSEERHKKQLEKLQSKGQSESKEYVQPKSAKDIAVEKLEKKGYKAETSSGIPMYNVKTQDDVDTIRDVFQDKGSFGFRCPKGMEIDKERKEEDVS
jgi:hypothetical protein